MSFKKAIQTPKGLGFLRHERAPAIILTDLGYVMLKVWYPEKQCYINHKLCDIKEILSPEFTIINEAYEYVEQPETTITSLG
jgi:hypothetical protein